MKKLYYWLLGCIFAFGIFLRTNTYFLNRSMWHDECSLALSIIHRGVFGFFAPLEHVQFAPPAFMMMTKILTKIFNEGEMVLRFIPFVCGILGIFAFYFLSKKIFQRKFLLLLVNFLFIINLRLIFYSQEFKQYSCDVFSHYTCFFSIFKARFIKNFI